MPNGFKCIRRLLQYCRLAPELMPMIEWSKPIGEDAHDNLRRMFSWIEVTKDTMWVWMWFLRIFDPMLSRALALVTAAISAIAAGIAAGIAAIAALGFVSKKAYH
jgi:hypothetical protein